MGKQVSASVAADVRGAHVRSISALAECSFFGLANISCTWRAFPVLYLHSSFPEDIILSDNPSPYCILNTM